jgi:hypothetical protein
MRDLFRKALHRAFERRDPACQLFEVGGLNALSSALCGVGGGCGAVSLLLRGLRRGRDVIDAVVQCGGGIAQHFGLHFHGAEPVGERRWNCRRFRLRRRKRMFDLVEPRRDFGIGRNGDDRLRPLGLRGDDVTGERKASQPKTDKDRGRRDRSDRRTDGMDQQVALRFCGGLRI